MVRCRALPGHRDTTLAPTLSRHAAALLSCIGRKRGLIVRPRPHHSSASAYVSDSAVELLGRSREDLLGSSEEALLANGESAKLRAWRHSMPDSRAFATRLRGHAGAPIPARLFTGDNETAPDVYILADPSGSESGVVAPTADKHLCDSFERVPASIAMFLDHRLHFTTRQFREAFGYARSDELLGRHLEELITPIDRSTSSTICEPSEGPPAAASAIEFRLPHADGRMVDVGVACVALQTRPIPKVVMAVHDARHDHASTAEMLLSERWASLGTLVAGVAHEINNPLAYVLLNLHFVSEKLPASVGNRELQKRLLARLVEAQHGATRVSAIVRDLRSFSRSDAADHAKAVDIRRVLEQALQMLDLPHPVVIHRKFEATPTILGNATKLEQVFLNLLVNAVQALTECEPARRFITICVRVSEIEGKDFAEISISDTGAGIAPHLLDRVFDPFFTTKGPAMGTGLGLPICHNIVTRLGGEIRAESTPGIGTTFQVRLPCSESKSSAPPLAPLTPEPANLAPRARLLIIDDEPQVAMVLARLLEPEHEVVVSMNGRQALDLLRVDQNFDLLLCDLLMPGVSGMDIYRELIQRAAEIAKRMVFITGGAFTPRAAQFLQEVPNPRLDKPFALERVRVSVRKLVLALGPRR